MISSIGRASVLNTEGRRFDSDIIIEKIVKAKAVAL